MFKKFIRGNKWVLKKTYILGELSKGRPLQYRLYHKVFIFEIVSLGHPDTPNIMIAILIVSDGKALAVSRDCKFIETSSGIQHNVDELLVGVLKQIRLRDARDKKQQMKKSSSRQLHGSKTSLSLNIAREILQKICMNDISKSKSCENLHVL